MILRSDRMVVLNRKPKILIVDDDEFNYLALSSLLMNLGYQSDYANNGKAAIKMMQNNQARRDMDKNVQ